MHLQWAAKALSDIARLHEFLAAANPSAAARTIKSLVAAPTVLSGHPRIGEKLAEFEPREVRRLLVGPYELRYEIRNHDIVVLRVWHTREKR